MYSPDPKLMPDQTDFSFPYPPYRIQQELMQNLYQILTNRQIGIFESPTGTGKSLTLTCAAMAWLLDRENLVLSDLRTKMAELEQEVKRIEGSAGGDWITQQYAGIQANKKLMEYKMISEHIRNYNSMFFEMKERIRKYKTNLRFGGERRDQAPLADLLGMSLLLRTMDANLIEEALVEADDEQLPEPDGCEHVQILFCSRTHSQLAQIAAEIKTTKFAADIRVVTLGSRKNMCIHPMVKRLESAAMVNEQCLEMQKKTVTTKRDPKTKMLENLNLVQEATICEFRKKTNLEDLREAALSDILDIEDLRKDGELLRACPYYATRRAVKDAHVVLLPYQTLLHRKTRQQCGVVLKNSIVIIDEAHNLLDTISAMHWAGISLDVLRHALLQIAQYKEHYIKRLSQRNLLIINKMLFILKRLVKMLEVGAREPRWLKTHELMDEGQFFNIDLHELLKFADERVFGRKVFGLAVSMRKRQAMADLEKENPAKRARLDMLKKMEVAKAESKSQEQPKAQQEGSAQENSQQPEPEATPSTAHQNCVHKFLDFLEKLTECAADGKVLITYSENPAQAAMQFHLFNPGGHFQDLVEECRSIIIAGGTMQPTEQLVDTLFKSCKGRVKEHFYDHVVPANAVLPFALSTGPSGRKFSFTFNSRNNPEMLQDLAMTILNICNVVPAGIVCFFTSYEYMFQVTAYLGKHGVTNQIAKRKYICTESKAKSAESVLAHFSQGVTCSKKSGAILFCVIGGKLSEGLNFKDDLGRCVIVVGMPYANAHALDMKEKMRCLDEQMGAGAGSEFYENLCMKAVNQCIGRSIRHINDYAAVVLIDDRYQSKKVQNKLPKWISRSLQGATEYTGVHNNIVKFFAEKNAEEEAAHPTVPPILRTFRDLDLSPDVAGAMGLTES